MISTLKSAIGGKLAVPALPPALRNNRSLLLGLAVAITAAVMMFLWQDQSSYKPVFGVDACDGVLHGLSKREAALRIVKCTLGREVGGRLDRETVGFIGQLCKVGFDQAGEFGSHLVPMQFLCCLMTTKCDLFCCPAASKRA